MSEGHHQATQFVPLANATKAQKYQRVREQLENRLDESSHPIANTANLLAILKQQFNWWWIGYYWLRNIPGKEHLTLGHFQGPPACPKLFKGVGVCGTAWLNQQSIVLEDVNEFKGHIACSAASKSQIVIPIFSGGVFVGVLDIDSVKYGDFDEQDEKELKALIEQIEKIGHFKWFIDHI